MAILPDTTINGVSTNVLRPVPDLIRVLRDEIFMPGGPLSPMAQGDAVMLMQSDEARIRLVNNTYVADLDQRTAAYLNTQGLKVVEFGTPTGYTSRAKVILYTSKLYALRYVKEVFGLEGPQITIQPDPASTVDMEIRLGEDGIGLLR